MDETGREFYRKQLALERTSTVKGTLGKTTHMKQVDIEFDNPPAQTKYTTELMDVADLKSQTSEKKNFHRKVGSYVVESFNQSLNYTKK